VKKINTVKILTPHAVIKFEGNYFEVEPIMQFQRQSIVTHVFDTYFSARILSAFNGRYDEVGERVFSGFFCSLNLKREIERLRNIVQWCDLIGEQEIARNKIEWLSKFSI
jgi:hypothetical protein